MEKSRVFLSHAVKDKQLADMLVDLIISCGALTPEEVFCTSLEGLGVPAGKDFLDVIKEELQEPDLVIFLISENYLNSHFCLCELGASWAMSHNSLPILAPPLTYADMSAVISTTQAILLNVPTAMNGMIEQIVSILGKPTINNSRWEAKRDEFLSRFNRELALSYENISKTSKTPKVVAQDEDSYKEYKEKYTKSKTSEDKEDLVLIMLSEEPNFSSTPSDIADALGIKKVLCQYHIDHLLEKDLLKVRRVEGVLGIIAPTEYQLTKSGRYYLVNEGKV